MDRCITKEEFEDLSMKGMTYEGYVYGEGFAFLDATFGLKKLGPNVMKVGRRVNQYLDKSPYYIKKSIELYERKQGAKQTNNSWNAANQFVQGEITFVGGISEFINVSTKADINGLTRKYDDIIKRLEKLKNDNAARNPSKYSYSEKIEFFKSKQASLRNLPVDKAGKIEVSKEAMAAAYGKKAGENFSKVSRGAKLLGGIGVVLQSGISIYNVGYAYKYNDERKGRITIKAVADVAVPVICIVAGGPVAWVVGGAYLFADITGGLDWALDTAYDAVK